jgi:hypothetical protein
MQRPEASPRLRLFRRWRIGRSLYCRTVALRVYRGDARGVSDFLIRIGPWAVAVVGLIFQAGLLYAAMKGLRTDLNGVGRKVRGIQEANEQRYLTLALLAILDGVPENRRTFYMAKARLVLDAGRGRNL